MKQDISMRTLAIFILVLFAGTAYSQNSINNFKYVLVPEKFEFSKIDNQYGLNTLAKLLLEQQGFTVFQGDEPLPADLAANKCRALTAEVVQKKGLFVTNLTLLLKDCQGDIIFKSKEGKSREKEYQVAFELALRDAFSSLNDVAYKYDSSTALTSPAIATVPAPSVVSAPAPATTTVPTQPQAPATAPAVTENTGTLYAQSTPTGFQLIDTTPKKILTLGKTSLQDHFIAQGDGINGVVFLNNGEWVLEYYQDNKLVSRKLQIKF